MAYLDLPHRSLSSTERPRALDRVTSWGIIVAVGLLFAVSGGMLWRFGYNYDGLTGGAVTKIHPFTYCIVLVTAWRMASFGNPVAFAAHAAVARPAALVMGIAGVLLLTAVVLRKGPGMAGIIDTWIAPALLALLLADASERDLQRLTILLHVVMTANGLLSIFEFLSKTLLFPYRFEGAAFEWDTRSTSLQGHPLVNATITGIYVMALVSGCRNIPTPMRIALIGIQSAALVVFGGRTSMVFSLLIGGSWFVAMAVRRFFTNRIPLLGAACVLVGLAILPLLIVPLVSSGSLDSILMRFVSDGGSANARVLMFELFEPFSVIEILIGPDVELVESMRRIAGLEWGIENPFIRSALYNGAFLTAVMFVAYILFIRETVRGRLSGIWMPILIMAILFNAAESVASKTTMIAKVFVILICAYPLRERFEQYRVVGTMPAGPGPR